MMPEHRQERREMKKAWAVSRKYDHKVSGHTVERTKARAVAEARRLAEFYKSHGREIVSLKNRCGDMFFVKGDEDDRFTIHVDQVEVGDQLWDML